jgi:hypothetical protein
VLERIGAVQPTADGGHAEAQKHTKSICKKARDACVQRERACRFETYDGLIYMAWLIIGVMLATALVYFPMWCGMLCEPQAGAPPAAATPLDACTARSV